MDMDTIDQYIVLTKWGCKWLKFAWNIVVDGGPATKLSGVVLKHLDESSLDPLDFVDGYIYENKKTIFNAKDNVTQNVGVVERRKLVIKKGSRSKFAASIACIAYNKFGNRKMTEANVLVTRKWIQKYLDEPTFKDLRIVDKNIAIDRALFLSFVPTTDFQKMTLVTETSTWKNRMNADSVFGKIFQLVTSSSNTEVAGL